MEKETAQILQTLPQEDQPVCLCFEVHADAQEYDGRAGISSQSVPRAGWLLGSEH